MNHLSIKDLKQETRRLKKLTEVKPMGQSIAQLQREKIKSLLTDESKLYELKFTSGKAMAKDFLKESLIDELDLNELVKMIESANAIEDLEGYLS